ncbi:MAG: S-layer homology domain-containing protein, partial [Pyramidobacter sp.]|nr:S-layer homology domain-containing protein [Pyramidobacter sp.]
MSMKKMLAVAAAASLAAAPAFAANPFSDVPMNHWAYDAVEQMAAKGILEGYPNGTFKGNRAMTRYEIAQMVARMMAKGVGGADADQLQKLIDEFAPELEALGVKVDGFDGRLSKLEKGVGGWHISGEMQFDFNG